MKNIKEEKFGTAANPKNQFKIVVLSISRLFKITKKYSIRESNPGPSAGKKDVITTYTNRVVHSNSFFYTIIIPL